MAVTSDPGSDSTYVIGDTVQVSVIFSEAVTVSGQPQLGLSIGGQSSTANYNGGSGTSTVVFSYDVREGDHGGVVIGSNAIDLNGGSISASSGGKAASLSHRLHTANHIVDAVRRGPAERGGGRRNPGPDLRRQDPGRELGADGERLHGERQRNYSRG